MGETVFFLFHGKGSGMAKMAVVDADLISRKKHRFPNLACMKLSGYHKDRGDEVVLKTDYEETVSAGGRGA